MMEHQEHPRPTQRDLLAHLGRVRRLARCLVRDPNLAEDILQDVYALALERPPRRAVAGPQLWAWMRRVACTLARQHHRSERRRRVREENAACAEHEAPFTESLILREEAGAVLAVLERLPEPYGSTLRLRLQQGLAPAEIARLQGVPAATVRMRLTRGLRRARAELEPRRARRQVGGLLLGLRDFFRAQPARAAWVGGGALLVVAGSVSGIPRTGVSVDSQAALSAPGKTECAPVAMLATSAPVDRRALDAQPREQPARGEHAAGCTCPSVTGRALWASGQPVAELPVKLVGQLPGGTGQAPPALSTSSSAADGSFRIRSCLPEAGVGWLTADDPALVTVMAGTLDREALLGAPVLVVARATQLRGVVRDGAGEELAGARVTWLPAQDLEQRLDASVVFSRPVEIRAETDANGRFVIDSLPELSGARLAVRLPGRPPQEVPLTVPLLDPFEIVLADGPRPVRGRVLDTLGQPVEGAAVCSGFERTWSDSTGRFELRVEEQDRPPRLRVARSGFTPALFELESAGEADPFHEVVLPAEKARITGRVTDREGRPLAGIQVLARDLEAAHWDGRTLWSLEGLSADPPRPVPQPVLTGADGTFDLHGLQARPYTVLAIDPSSLLAAQATLHPGESAATLVLDAGELLPQVEGSVAATDGTPVERATIWVVRETVRILRDDRALHTGHLFRDSAPSGSDGTFVLRDVPRDASVRVESADFFPLLCEPAARLELRAHRRCEFVLTDVPGRTRDLRFRDTHGSQLPVLERDELSTSLALLEGRTGVMTIPADATSVELIDPAGDVLATVALTLRAHSLNRASALGASAP